MAKSNKAVYHTPQSKSMLKSDSQPSSISNVRLLTDVAQWARSRGLSHTHSHTWITGSIGRCSTINQIYYQLWLTRPFFLWPLRAGWTAKLAVKCKLNSWSGVLVTLSDCKCKSKSWYPVSSDVSMSKCKAAEVEGYIRRNPNWQIDRGKQVAKQTGK